MKKVALAAAIAAILVLVLWLLRQEAPVSEIAHTAAPASPSAPVEPQQRLAVADPGVQAEPREAIRAAPPRVESAPAPAVEPMVDPATLPPFDESARDWIHLIVQDRLGAPIANAEIRMTGLRSTRDPGSHTSWWDEPSVGRTETDGTAKLWHPVWINADSPTGAVSLVIEHPEYITHGEQDFKIGPTPRVIVLEQGAFVVVSGWFESSSEVVRDVMPHMTWGAKIKEDAWLPIKDGRLSCANVPPGRHGIYLSHTSAEHGTCFSEAELFEIAAGEQKEVHLQLFPGRRFEGRLDPAVPRPIVNGAVKLNLQIGERASLDATMLREYDAQVSADGTFAFTDLPPGDGQMIGCCDGWVSARVPAGPEDLVQRNLSPEEAQKQIALLGDQALVPQSVGASMDGAAFVLRMEPAASLQATLVDTDGKPVEGALLSVWPNVHWRTGYASLFMQRVFDGTTDEHGRVTLTNLPSGRVFGGVQHARYALSEKELGRRHVEIELESGKTREMRIEVEAKKGE